MFLNDENASIWYCLPQRIDNSHLIDIKRGRGIDRSLRCKVERIVNEAFWQLGNFFNIVLRNVPECALTANRLTDPSEIPHQRETDENRLEQIRAFECRQRKPQRSLPNRW